MSPHAWEFLPLLVQELKQADDHVIHVVSWSDKLTDKHLQPFTTGIYLAEMRAQIGIYTTCRFILMLV